MTADVVGLYPNIPHSAGLNALGNMLQAREHKALSTEDLVKMVRFVLQNNYFEFNGDFKKQISGTVIGTKFAPSERVYLWMILKLNFYNPNHCNLWFCLDTLMTLSFFGLLAMTNLKSS